MSTHTRHNGACLRIDTKPQKAQLGSLRWALGVPLSLAAVAAWVVLDLEVPGCGEQAPLDVLVLDNGTDTPLPPQPAAGAVLTGSEDKRLLAQIGRDPIGVGPRSEIRIVAASQGHVQLQLLEGSVALEVARRRDKEEVEVKVGDYLVRVSGARTRFMVTVAADGAFDVDVARGKVRVSGVGMQPQSVMGGGRLSVAATGQTKFGALPERFGRRLERLLRAPGTPYVRTPMEAAPEKMKTPQRPSKAGGDSSPGFEQN